MVSLPDGSHAGTATQMNATAVKKEKGDNFELRSTQGLDDPVRDTVFNLSRIRKSIDPRTKGFLDAYTKIAYFFKERREKKYLSDSERGKLDSRVNTLNAERTKLQNNREIQEELIAE